jgi:hypothetical protein
MGFNRLASIGERPEESSLTRDMAGIGMNFAVAPNPNPLIEETLVFASCLGMDDHDLRVLAVLTTWLAIHHPRINLDRLVRSLSAQSSERVRSYWAAIGTWLAKDRRFTRLRSLYDGPPLDLLPIGTDFQIARRGEDDRFRNSSLRVPAGTLRERDSDVVPPEILVCRHATYRNRVIMGPTWRADVWTVLDSDPDLSVAEVARRVGTSFATAWHVVQDHRLLTSTHAKHSRNH